MRQIKFRGVDTVTGNYVYGDLYQREGKVLIHEHPYIAAKYVKPDTVAQLVGFDKDGKEVYEGDTVVDRDNRQFPARLRPNFTSIAILKEPDHEEKVSSAADN